jgi:tetratricopeptide (TPR) repeat protein
MMSLSEQATLYMVAAVRMYGDAVLSATRRPDADAGVELGQRLMRHVFGAPGGGEQLPKVVQDLIARPGDGRAAPAELEGYVYGALVADPDLEAVISQELITFYEQEIAAGNTQAMVERGDLLRSQEDPAGARVAYQGAIEAGNAHALIDLARLLRGDLGDAEGARAALRQAVDSDDPDLAAEATVELGYLLMISRDYADAQACFQQAMRSGHADWAPAAMVGLGRLLEKQGNAAGAQAAYQRAAEAGNADCTAHALVFLGVMLRKQGDRNGARAAFQRVVDSGNADWSPPRPKRTPEPVSRRPRMPDPCQNEGDTAVAQRPARATRTADDLRRSTLGALLI